MQFICQWCNATPRPSDALKVNGNRPQESHGISLSSDQECLPLPTSFTCASFNTCASQSRVPSGMFSFYCDSSIPRGLYLPGCTEIWQMYPFSFLSFTHSAALLVWLVESNNHHLHHTNASIVGILSCLPRIISSSYVSWLNVDSRPHAGFYCSCHVRNAEWRYLTPFWVPFACMVALPTGKSPEAPSSVVLNWAFI